VGPPIDAHPRVYADTSPAELGAGPEPQVQINGEEDPLAPPSLALRYAAKLPRARLSNIAVPETGHVELIAPGTVAWDQVVESLNALVQ
jgi:pimeloyl-ACP methyl ester carboxylesterase